MRTMNLCIKEGEPIISTWISADGNFAFVEFRSPEEATNGFALSQINIHGNVNFKNNIV